MNNCNGQVQNDLRPPMLCPCSAGRLTAGRENCASVATENSSATSAVSRLNCRLPLLNRIRCAIERPLFMKQNYNAQPRRRTALRRFRRTVANGPKRTLSSASKCCTAARIVVVRDNHKIQQCLNSLLAIWSYSCATSHQ